MGREVRYVTEDWQPHNRAKFDGLEFEEDLKNWEKQKRLWDKGQHQTYDGKIVALEKTYPDIDFDGMSFEEWHGPGPNPDDYTPTRLGDELTHMVMYENTSDGTPISPKFPIDDAEGLATWLADNNASSCGSMTASKEEWLSMIDSGFAPSAVSTGGELKSGVETMGAANSK